MWCTICVLFKYFIATDRYTALSKGLKDSTKFDITNVKENL